MARAEVISVDAPALTVEPGDTFSVLFLLQDNSTPLFGYSLDIEATGSPNSVGSIVADITLTNFFDSRNLITAGGAVRDPLFSVIVDNGNDGVFISTNTDDGSTVLANDGVNDVLAQVFFYVSEDASGDFQIDLNPGSVLSNAEGDAVIYNYLPGTVTVVPAPAAIMAISTFVFGCVTGRRGRAAR